MPEGVLNWLHVRAWLKELYDLLLSESQSRAGVLAWVERDPARAHAYARRHKIPCVHDGHEALIENPAVVAIAPRWEDVARGAA